MKPFKWALESGTERKEEEEEKRWKASILIRNFYVDYLCLLPRPSPVPDEIEVKILARSGKGTKGILKYCKNLSESPQLLALASVWMGECKWKAYWKGQRSTSTGIWK